MSSLTNEDFMSYSINDKGQIVIAAEAQSDEKWRSFRFTPGIGIEDIGMYNGIEIYATDINNKSWITGEISDVGTFLYKDNSGFTIVCPGRGTGINDNGTIIGYLETRRDQIYAELRTNNYLCSFEISNNSGNNYTNSTANITLFGLAPIDVKSINTKVNGVPLNSSLTWSLVTTWNIPISLQVGANTITVQGYDCNGNTNSNWSDSITITYQP